MAEKRSLTDVQILQRIPRARLDETADRARGLRASSAHYDVERDLLVIVTSTRVEVGIPRERIAALAKLPAAALTQVEVTPDGHGLHWDEHDVDLSVPGLLLDAIGSPVASEMARRGGKVSTEAKAEAARRNGARGGRPRTRRVRGEDEPVLPLRQTKVSELEPLFSTKVTTASKSSAKKKR
jgi:hypothetical protein